MVLNITSELCTYTVMNPFIRLLNSPPYVLTSVKSGNNPFKDQGNSPTDDSSTKKPGFNPFMKADIYSTATRGFNPFLQQENLSTTTSHSKGILSYDS